MFTRIKEYFQKRKEQKEKRDQEAEAMLCLMTMKEAGFFDGMILVTKDEKYKNNKEDK